MFSVIFMGIFLPNCPIAASSLEFRFVWFFNFLKLIYFTWRLITLQYCIGFAIHWHNPPQVYMCSPSWTPLPPPSSLPIPSLWVVPVHQPQASSIHFYIWELSIHGFSYPWGSWNQSVVSCAVLIVASWPAYRFLKRQIRWSGIPISFRIFHSWLWSTQSKAFARQESRNRCFPGTLLLFRLSSGFWQFGHWFLCLF